MKQLHLINLDTVRGDDVEAGRAFGTSECCNANPLGQTLLDFFTPVSGRVIRLNSDLDESPDLAITDPYNSGWLIEIRMSDDSELAQLMSPQDYEDFLAELS